MLSATRIKARVGTGEAARDIDVRGRTAWALDNLIAAGETGCTPITTPGPRWSDYVFKLRKRGVPVETIDERHAGPYAGSHARYVLSTPVEIVAVERAVA